MKVLLVFEENQRKSVGFYPIDFGRRHSILYASLSEKSSAKLERSLFCSADKVFVLQDFHKVIVDDLVGKNNKEVVNLGLSQHLHGRELNWALKNKLEKYLN